ncbi:DUF6117 family protein [Neorhizobium vignae]|uniref:DUF6117 family protein n=1 Tax=Neorhizobium vignae TaxID=690585 RepID=UPI003D80EA74
MFNHAWLRPGRVCEPNRRHPRTRSSAGPLFVWSTPMAIPDYACTNFDTLLRVSSDGNLRSAGCV